MYASFIYRSMVYRQLNEDISVAGIAAAIGEPARTRILFSLLDGHARNEYRVGDGSRCKPFYHQRTFATALGAGLDEGYESRQASLF